MKEQEIRAVLDSIKANQMSYKASGYGKPMLETALVDDLARYECAGLTARRARSEDEVGVERDPIVIARGEGAFIWDADGRPYVDMGACFAVAAYGHANVELVEALTTQAQKMMHGMGDVYPTDTKVTFLKRLAELAPGNLNQALLSQSGAEAVETAIKMAQMATKRHRMIAFESCYHGLSYGALSVTGHSDAFKAPFMRRICAETTYVPYANCVRCAFGQTPDQCGFTCLRHLERLLRAPSSGCGDVAAVIAEPVQGRGGDIVPPKGWLKALRDVCTRNGVLLILDEIYTGFGRTGARFACMHEDVVPDILCLGKAMTGGFPLSAAIATPQVLRHWPLNTAEAIHTSTFLGNPMGCAVGLKAMEILERDQLAQRAAKLGDWLLSELRRIAQARRDIIYDVRGKGFMIGIEFADKDGTPRMDLALKIVDEMRDHGFMLLPSGPWSQVVSLSPPLMMPKACLEAFLEVFETCVLKIRA